MRDIHIDYYWVEDFFHCSIEQLLGNQDVIYPHYFLRGFNGIFIMKFYDKFVISAPEKYLERLKKASKINSDFFDAEILKNLLGDDFHSISSISWLGYYNKTAPPHYPADTKIIDIRTSDNKNLIDELKNSCDPLEWKHADIDNSAESAAVKIIDDKIVSIASYKLLRMKKPQIIQVGIITHPDFRREGFAKDTLTCITKFSQNYKYNVQFRTSYKNKAAISTAMSCGYELYAPQLTVRLNH